MDKNLKNTTIKIYAIDWKKMSELYGKNRAEELRKAIKKLIIKAEAENSKIKKLTNEKK